MLVGRGIVMGQGSLRLAAAGGMSPNLLRAIVILRHSEIV